MENPNPPYEPDSPASTPSEASERHDGAVDPPAPESKRPRSRREFLADATAVSVGAAVGVMADEPTAAAEERSSAGLQTAPSAAGQVPATLQVNGKAYPMQVEPRVSLLDALREQAHLTGTKKGCDHGQCGACTVHIDGRRVLSCLTLAVMHEGQKITTIEGLAEGEHLHPMQAAFLSHDGFQCGFCTPGQIMSAVAMVQEGHAHSDDEIRESMSGNLCRCGAYPHIVAAIRSAMEGKTDASV
jgi:xanthine dehydrogenase YagT iron-sulfur-binding subunit